MCRYVRVCVCNCVAVCVCVCVSITRMLAGITVETSQQTRWRTHYTRKTTIGNDPLNLLPYVSYASEGQYYVSLSQYPTENSMFRVDM